MQELDCSIIRNDMEFVRRVQVAGTS